MGLRLGGEMEENSPVFLKTFIVILQLSALIIGCMLDLAEFRDKP
jgi:hypothetical protein